MNFTRYAVYYAPPEDAPWARFAAAWLGWDMAAGTEISHPDLPGLPQPVADITATPRKYGLHGTMKPPFRLAIGRDRTGLEDACAALFATLPRVQIRGPVLARLGGFLALCPAAPAPGLDALAKACVTGLDAFRAPPPEAELARRRAARLSPRQETNLVRWGYPYVLGDFRFHMTLTGRLPRKQAEAVQGVLQKALDPLLPDHIDIADMALAGEDDQGRFHLLHRFPLSG